MFRVRPHDPGLPLFLTCSPSIVPLTHQHFSMAGRYRFFSSSSFFEQVTTFCSPFDMIVETHSIFCVSPPPASRCDSELAMLGLIGPCVIPRDPSISHLSCHFPPVLVMGSCRLRTPLFTQARGFPADSMAVPLRSFSGTAPSPFSHPPDFRFFLLYSV